MNMMKKIRLFSMMALLLLFSGIPGTAGAAEFDLDAGRVVLRQLQYCADCGAALLVTHVHPGTLVRCPDCGKEQPRLSPEYVLTQLYQMCKVCGGPLNPEGHRPGEVVECGNCHTRQPLTSDVFRRGDHADGLGYVPGFPPGTGKKTLLLSPNLPEAAITMIPLDDGASELPLPPDLATGRLPARRIPAPLEGMLRRSAEPATPEDAPGSAAPPAAASASASAAAVPEDTLNLAPPLAARSADGAVDVPAVTADLFGARRPAGAGADAGYGSPGKVLARVNGQPIYQRDVDRLAEPVMARLRESAGPSEAEAVAAREKTLRREVLERLIDREVMLREAEALGYRPDPAEVRAREAELGEMVAGTGVDMRREAVRDVTLAAMRRRYAEKPGAANPGAVREFYARHKDGMTRPRLVALDQLVVYEDRFGKADARNYREIALEISGLLESGEKFDVLRERYDEFLPLAGLAHGAGALRPVGAYAGQVALAGGDLRKGGVFGPLFMVGLAAFGKVTDERPAGPVAFEEVEGDIRRRLEVEATEKNLQDWLKRLRGRARIEIAE